MAGADLGWRAAGPGWPAEAVMAGADPGWRAAPWAGSVRPPG